MNAEILLKKDNEYYVPLADYARMRWHSFVIGFALGSLCWSLPVGIYWLNAV